MDRIFSSVINFARQFTGFGLNYYISIGLFALCMLGALAGVIDNYLTKKKRSSAWLFSMYIVSLLVNVALCLSECFFKGQYFKSPVDAYAFCFSQFAVCMVFWLMLQSDAKQQNKAVNDAAENSNDTGCLSGTKCPIIDLYKDLLSEYKAIVNKEDSQKYRANIVEIPEKTAVSPIEEIVNFDDDENKTDDLRFGRQKENVDPIGDYKCEIPDINVAYVNNLITALLAKNIQPDEREKLQELKLKMSVLPTLPSEISELNALLRFLLKKVVEYDIPA